MRGRWPLRVGDLVDGAGEGVERGEDRLPDGRARPEAQVVEALEHGRTIGGGGHEHGRAAGERQQPQPEPGRQVLGERTRARRCAAANRLGATSVACIEAETSMASITVACSRGTFTARVGRAKPTTSRLSAARSAAAGRWRRQPGRFGATDASSATLVKRTVYRAAGGLRHEVGGDERADQRGATRAARSARNVTGAPLAGRSGRVRIRRRRATKRTMSRSQSRSVRSVRWGTAGAAQGPGDLGPLAGGGLGVARGARLPRAVCTSMRRPVSGSTRVSRPTAGSSSSRGSSTSTASTSWRRAHRPEQPLPSRGVEEVGDHHDEAPAPGERADGAQGGAQVGAGPRSAIAFAVDARVRHARSRRHPLEQRP